MTSTLLAVDGMSDVSFNLKDVIYLVTLVVSIITAIFKIQRMSEKNKDATAVLEKNLEDYKAQKEKEFKELKEITNERFDHAKHGRVAVKKELEKTLEKLERNQKDHQQKTQEDFNLMGSQISEVKSDTSEIKGKLDMLLREMQNKK